MTNLPDTPNMFKENLRTCMKCIREYDPLQYKDVMNAELDLIGFRLHNDTEPVAHINDSATTNVNNNITTSINDGIFELHSPSLADIGAESPLHESFCDVWFRSDSPNFLSVSRPAIDKIDKKGNSDCKVLAK